MKFKVGDKFQWTEKWFDELEADEPDDIDFDRKYLPEYGIVFTITKIIGTFIKYSSKKYDNGNEDGMGDHCFERGWTKIIEFKINPNFIEYVKKEVELK